MNNDRELSGMMDDAGGKAVSGAFSRLTVHLSPRTAAARLAKGAPGEAGR